LQTDPASAAHTIRRGYGSLKVIENSAVR